MNATRTRCIQRTVIAVTALAALAACSDDSSSTSDPVVTEPAATQPAATEPAPTETSAAEPEPAGATVTISGGAFSIPASVTGGEEVTVTNTGVAPHTFSEVNGLFSISVNTGESATFVAPAAGSYEVVCLIHSSMTGTLVVE